MDKAVIQEAEEILVGCKKSLLRKAPHWGTQLMSLKSKPTTSVKYMGTDGVSNFYNPYWVVQCRDSGQLWVIEFTLAHEVLHCDLNHHTRRGGRDFGTWNEAGDYLVNWILTQAGFRRPEWALFDSKYGNMNVYTVFDILWGEKNKPKEDEQKEDQQQEEESNEDQDDQSQQDESSGDDGEQESEEDGDSESEGDGNSDGESESDSPADGSEGEGEGDQGEGQENGSISPKQGSNGQPGDQGEGECPGTVFDFPGESDEDFSEEEEKWDSMMRSGRDLAVRWGKLPGDQKELIDSILEPKADWREELANWLNERCRNKMTWERPNKRYMASTGLYLPSKNGRTLGKVYVIMDTSGSVSGKLLKEMISEIYGLLETFNIEALEVLYVDSKFHGVQEVTAHDTEPWEILGRGGTSFRPGFEWIEEEGEVPVGVIYLTDGECADFPLEEPSYPVVWAIPRTNNWFIAQYFKPPFGQILDIWDNIR